MGWLVERPPYHVRFRLPRYDPGDMTTVVVLGGDYVLVVSTYTPGQTGPVKLCIASSGDLHAEPVPAQGLGMHVKTVKGTW